LLGALELVDQAVDAELLPAGGVFLSDAVVLGHPRLADDSDGSPPAASPSP
jgi:hypothetical protein